MATNGGPSIVRNGLVLCLDAANRRSYPTTGTVWSDLSGNGYNGTLVNGPTYSTANAGSIQFDGTNDYLTASSAVLPSGTNLFTFSIWINITNVTGNFGSGKAAVLFSGNSNGSIEGLLLPEGITAGPAYTLTLSRYGGSTVGALTVIMNMLNSIWYNISVVRDASNSQKVYLNGQLVGTGNVSNSFNVATFHHGGAPNNNEFSAYLNGRTSSIMMYNRALTAAEILQNYNATKSRFGL